MHLLEPRLLLGILVRVMKLIERVCEFMKSFKFDRFNVFFYSNEETTPAFTMKPVPEETIENRIEVLEEIAMSTTEYSLRNMLGKTIRVYTRW